jgi:DNA-directed RNA polymerase specialized sigma24 family protein
VRDDQGFAEFATANARRLRHAARLLTGDEDRAEDLLQTALARTYLRWHRIRSDDPTADVRRVLYTAHAD